jgi:hypothetical protein
LNPGTTVNPTTRSPAAAPSAMSPSPSASMSPLGSRLEDGAHAIVVAAVVEREEEAVQQLDTARGGQKARGSLARSAHDKLGSTRLDSFEFPNEPSWQKSSLEITSQLELARELLTSLNEPGHMSGGQGMEAQQQQATAQLGSRQPKKTVVSPMPDPLLCL